jgi:hypothetical protein
MACKDCPRCISSGRHKTERSAEAKASAEGVNYGYVRNKNGISEVK